MTDEATYAENVHVLSFPVQNVIISWFKLRKFEDSLIYAQPYWTERQEPSINYYIVANKTENVKKVKQCRYRPGQAQRVPRS